MKLQVFIIIASTVSPVFGSEQTNTIPESQAKAIVHNNSTNELYYTDDGEVFLEGAKGMSINPKRTVEARTNRESWLAKDFPEGNWGEEKEGGQISLRLEKVIFTNQEPIKMVVLVRNTTNHPLIFLNANDVAPGEINFWAYTQSNQIIASRPKYTGLRQLSGGGVNIVRPGLQRKYVDTLNRTYDLSSGKYFVEASITVSPLTETNIASPSVQWEIKSAKVPIEIR